MEVHPKYGHEVWFLTGLVSFLIGHVLFMLAMRSRISDITKTKRVHNNNKWALPLMVVFAVSMVAIIVPHVDDPVLKVGVVLYATIIASMTTHSFLLSTCETNMHDFNRH